MNQPRLGAVAEARYFRDILVHMPTLDNFANYRKAVINVSRIMDCSFTEATEYINNHIN
jgi:hypothetical protein